MKPGNSMSQRTKREYLEVMYERYQHATKAEKHALLDEVCRVCGYHRKYAIRKLKAPCRPATPRQSVKLMVAPAPCPL